MTGVGGPLPFSLEWLLEGSKTKAPLATCSEGHLVVAGKKHFRAVKFAQGLHAVLCEEVDHPEEGT